jgi:hypothetical protein
MMLRLKEIKPMELLLTKKPSTMKKSKRLQILKPLITRSKRRREMPELSLLSMHSMQHSGVFLNMKKPMKTIILLLFQR